MSFETQRNTGPSLTSAKVLLTSSGDPSWSRWLHSLDLIRVICWSFPTSPLVTVSLVVWSSVPLGDSALGSFVVVGGSGQHSTSPRHDHVTVPPFNTMRRCSRHLPRLVTRWRQHAAAIMAVLCVPQHDARIASCQVRLSTSTALRRVGVSIRCRPMGQVVPPLYTYGASDRFPSKMT